MPRRAPAAVPSRGAVRRGRAAFLACAFWTGLAWAAPDCGEQTPLQIGQGTIYTGRAEQSPEPWLLGRQFDHVLIVVLENQDYERVMRHPYFRRLAARGTLFSRYYALFHPSYPNYLAMIGGRYFGTTGNEQANLPASAQTLVDLLEARGLTWKAYAEAWPGHCDRRPEIGRRYVRRHVPFLSFDSIAGDPRRCAHVEPAERFDWRDLPNYAMYVPDLCHDGHDICWEAPVDRAAHWLEQFLAPAFRSPEALRNTLVVVTFDETENRRSNRVYTLFLGPMVAPGAVVSACYDHYSLLRTIEDNFGLGTLGAEDTRSAPMARAFSGNVPPPAR